MKIHAVLSMLVFLMLFTGCDIFRKIAGRPTSAELEAMKEEIVAADAKIQELKSKQQRQADSLAIVDSIRRMKAEVHTVSEIGALYSTNLDHKYYIIVGAFVKESNAEGMIRTVSDAGYIPVRISINKYTAVGICPSDDIEDAFLLLKGVYREPFCPADVWILVNR